MKSVMDEAKLKSMRLRKSWEGAKKLSDIRSAPSDQNVDPRQAAQNIKRRLQHLAKVLYLIRTLYREDKDLYGEAFLAFVGDKVIRSWPGKDFVFATVRAKEQLSRVDARRATPIWQLTRSRLEKVKELGVVYEHYTPISFFRDIFDSDEELTEEDFYCLLAMFYRVAWVTKEEDDQLPRTQRPLNEYPIEAPFIDLDEEQQVMWDELTALLMR